MKNESYNQVIEGYNNQLIHWNAKKKVLEQMIKDLNKQFTEASDTWDHVWREKQSYILDHEEKNKK
jgi:hypothetical protein